MFMCTRQHPSVELLSSLLQLCILIRNCVFNGSAWKAGKITSGIAFEGILLPSTPSIQSRSRPVRLAESVRASFLSDLSGSEATKMR
jgi:hypothetical protein